MRNLENFKSSILSDNELVNLKGGNTSQPSNSGGSDGGDLIEKDPPIYIKE